MKIKAIAALLFILAGALSAVDAASPKAAAKAATTAKAATAAKAATTVKKAATTTAKVPTAKAAAASPSSTLGPNINGEGLPNGSPTDTGCIDTCKVYPPPAPDGNTANSLELFHLSWFPSFAAGQMMNMSFWTTYNPSASAGAPPTTVNIDLYDQFGQVHLGSIAQNVAVKAPAANTEFVLSTWTIPSSVSANFNVSNQFMIVFTGASNWRRDRLVQLSGVTANPGGGPNPAYDKAVTGSPTAGSSATGTGSAASSSTSPTNAAVGLRSDLWTVVCVWTFLAAQVAGFMLL